MVKKPDIRKELARYGKMLHDRGFAIGHGGNISVRNGSNLVIKRKGADMSAARASDYLEVPFKTVRKGHPAVSSEAPLHEACYSARKDISAAAHVHSPVIVAAAEKTALLRSNSYEFDCILGKDVPVVAFIEPGSEELAAAVAREVKKGAPAVIMARHGAVAVGRDMEEAYLRVLALERACLTFLYSFTA